MKNFVVALLLFISGCAQTKNQFAQPRVITSAKVADAAKRYAADTLGFANVRVDKNKVYFGNGYYTVVVFHDPPGSIAVIDLSTQLEVIGWSPGQ